MLAARKRWPSSRLELDDIKVQLRGYLLVKVTFVVEIHASFLVEVKLKLIHQVVRTNQEQLVRILKSLVRLTDRFLGSKSRRG